MKLHPEIRKLLNEIHTYLNKTGLSQTRFGIEAVNDGHLVSRLQNGQEPRRNKIERVRAFMKRNGKRS